MESARLIFTALETNNNKFWHGHVEGTTVKTNWGRVGDVGQFKDYPCGSVASAEAQLAKQVAGKLKKGYTHQHTMVEGQKVQAAGLAKVQIAHNNDPETVKLIDFLVQRNIHKIEGMTTIRLEAGRLTTPLGVVTMEGLDEAERLLGLMATPGPQFEAQVNAYLRIVPRNIGRRRVDPRDLFGRPDQIKQELDTVDALRTVVKDLDQKADAGQPVVFQTKLDIVEDRKVFERLRRFYEGSKNSRHASANMSLHKAWAVSIEAMDKAFEAQLGNIRELWHGTKDSNLLSILKNGYIIPRSGSGVAITGRAFGDGVYFSDQSTKSLNYATGSAPGQYGGGSQRKFMLVNDVAMGREFNPRTTFHGGCPKGYDSTFARGGGVFLNNEMIVYRTSQIKPTFLCEFR